MRKEREKSKGGKERGGKQGLHFSLVFTVYSPESAKLKHGRKASVYTCICSVAVTLGYSIT